MHKLKYLGIALLFISISSFKVDDLPPGFTDLLTRSQMTFTSPEEYTEVPFVKNGQMNYEYALKNHTKTFEVRYTVRPLDSLLKKFETMEKNKQPGDVNLSPNKFYYPAFIAIMTNIAGGKPMGRINEFDKTSVKNEFNADWGAINICEPVGEFGKGYKFCVGVALHKDNIGDAYYFYLTDNREDFQTLMPTIFHVLKFK
ncbi:MAG TPA: hypothetical protein VK668_19660 [Mucilaginibacter sp.]|nr:hypothetical protein [Mucilaginibacter sp.]